MRILIALALSFFSTQALSENNLSECQQFKSEYKQVLNSEKKVISLNAARVCVSDMASTAKPKIILGSILDETGLNIGIQAVTFEEVKRFENKNQMEGTKYGIIIIGKITFYILCCLFIISLFTKVKSWLVNSDINQHDSVSEHFMPCAFLFALTIIFFPFGEGLSVAIILISILFGIIYALVSSSILFMTASVSAITYTKDYNSDLSKQTIETANSIVENSVNNYLKIEAAKTNRKNLDIQYHLVNGSINTPTHISVQSTLDCYSKANINAEYNSMLLTSDTMQNNKCYAEWTKLSSMQNFGYVQSSIDDTEKQAISRIVVRFESEISELQEEVRRYECVNSFNSNNKQTKNNNCIDYKNNIAVNESDYIKYISESLTKEELLNRKKAIIEKIRAAINQEVKDTEEKSLDEYIDKNLAYAKNTLVLAPFLTFVNTIYQNIGNTEYLDYFGKAVVIFNGYKIEGTNTQLQTSGSKANLASLTIPVEIEEFNSLANSFIFKKSNYFEQLLVKNNKECLQSFNNCETLKISTFGEFEKNTKETLTYLTKAHLLLSAFDSKSNNNQKLSFVKDLVMYTIIICLLLLAANFILPFFYHSIKTLYFFLLAFYSIIQLIFVIPFKSGLTWAFEGEYDIVYEVKQIVFNSMEASIYIISYVTLLTISFILISIFSIDFTTSNTISSMLFNFDISSWLNTVMSLALMIFISIKTHAYSEKITESICTYFEVKKFDEIESELMGYSNKALHKAKQILLK